MKKLVLMTCSVAWLLASSGCASSSASQRLIRPDPLKAPSLSGWIREPRLKPISTAQLQQILSGSDLREPEPSSVSTPASSSTTR